MIEAADKMHGLVEQTQEDSLIIAARRTMELIFFVHIDQAYSADSLLEKLQIGRPHHRVLYFTSANPGISVGDLTSLLRITNQGLARTINQLVSLGFIEQRYSLKDRRVRQHFVTAAGSELLTQLIAAQMKSILPAIEKMDPQVLEAMWRGLESMCRSGDRPWITPAPQGRIPPTAALQTARNGESLS